MSVDSDMAFKVAAAAIQRLAKDRGLDARFPFDAIWKYADKDISPKLKPTPQRRLVSDNYIEPTGGTINAESGPRAGSPGTEYKLGRRFRPEVPAAAAAATAPTQVSGMLRLMSEKMKAQGFEIAASALANFYLALKSSPFVILTGISGTGKSRLPRLFADAIGASFHFISVQPLWVRIHELQGPSFARLGPVPR